MLSASAGQQFHLKYACQFTEAIAKQCRSIPLQVLPTNLNTLAVLARSTKGPSGLKKSHHSLYGPCLEGVRCTCRLESQSLINTHSELSGSSGKVGRRILDQTGIPALDASLTQPSAPATWNCFEGLRLTPVIAHLGRCISGRGLRPLNL